MPPKSGYENYHGLSMDYLMQSIAWFDMACRVESVYTREEFIRHAAMYQIWNNLLHKDMSVPTEMSKLYSEDELKRVKVI